MKCSTDLNEIHTGCVEYNLVCSHKFIQFGRSVTQFFYILNLKSVSHLCYNSINIFIGIGVEYRQHLNS
jgi:hypothetical protein